MHRKQWSDKCLHTHTIGEIVLNINGLHLNINNSQNANWCVLKKKEKETLTCLCTAKTALLGCIIGGLYTGVMSI